MNPPSDSTSPAASLEEARQRMRWSVEAGVFGLALLERPLTSAELAGLRAPSQVIVEDGETTVLAAEPVLNALFGPELGSDTLAGDLVWIRFEAPMGWEVVGFLALVCGELATAEVPIGAVCSFHRDHLFVARKYLDTTRQVLTRLFPESGR